MFMDVLAGYGVKWWNELLCLSFINIFIETVIWLLTNRLFTRFIIKEFESSTFILQNEFGDYLKGW